MNLRQFLTVVLFLVLMFLSLFWFYNRDIKTSLNPQTFRVFENIQEWSRNFKDCRQIDQRPFLTCLF